MVASEHSDASRQLCCAGTASRYRADASETGLTHTDAQEAGAGSKSAGRGRQHCRAPQTTSAAWRAAGSSSLQASADALRSGSLGHGARAWIRLTTQVLSSLIAAWSDLSAALSHDILVMKPATSPAGYAWMFLNVMVSAGYVLGMRKRIKVTNFKVRRSVRRHR